MSSRFSSLFFAEPPHGSPSRVWTRNQALFVLALCLASRLATTIHYIEDTDSLRFALALVDFDVANLQPQFPGYPAFCFFAKCLSVLLGSSAAAFSALGGLGLFALTYYALASARLRLTEPRGLALAALLFFNPMLWLMGNRYMTDLSGGALALAAFYHLSRSESRKHSLTGFFLTGVLAGWRLSYAPFLVPALLPALAPRSKTLREKFALLGAGAAGVLIWLMPFIFVTGWNTLIETARHQTGGHFHATGGTYITEPEWGLRAIRLFSHLWADGLGAWQSGRHPVTLAVAAGAVLLLLLAAFKIRRTPAEPVSRLLLVSCVGYALWIFVFQNVIHQTRHVLPLVAPLLIALAAGLPREAFRRRDLRSVAFVVFFAAYAYVGVSLALQHKRPAAIAQAKAYLESFSDSSWTVVSAPWGVKCLSAQRVPGRYIPVETPEDFEALKRLDPKRPFVTVGNYSDHLDPRDRPLLAHRVFYHNPYVNRLGAKVEVFVYGPAR